MRFEETGLAGAFRIECEPREDERGFFVRTWCAREFEEHGIRPRVVQANLSGTRRRFTFRGLHLQGAPHQEAKLVRCTRGAIHDVILDLRAGSPTEGRWEAFELRADRPVMLYVPEGFAHGFLSLTDDVEVFYLMSEFYHPESQRGVRWDDPRFGIRLPGPVVRISQRDRSWPDW